MNLEASFGNKNSSKAYLVFFGTLSGFQRSLCDNVKNSLFSEVYFENHPNKTNKLFNLLKLIFNKYKSNKIYIREKESTEIFSQNLIFTLLGPYNRTKACKYHYIEEGLSSYTDFNHRFENRNFWIKMINTFMYNGRLIPKFEYLYIYNQSLYSGIMKTKILPKFDISLFQLKKKYDIQKEKIPKRIFLGTPIESIDSLLAKNLSGNDKNNFQLFVREKSESIFSVLKHEKFLYKAHPNEVLNGIYDGFEMYNTNLPWELTVNYCNDSNIFISFFSTAAITPKILFNKEPRVIFLFRLLQPYIFFQAEEFLIRIRNSYYNKDRVMAPRNVKELSEILLNF